MTLFLSGLKVMQPLQGVTYDASLQLQYTGKCGTHGFVLTHDIFHFYVAHEIYLKTTLFDYILVVLERTLDLLVLD